MTRLVASAVLVLAIHLLPVAAVASEPEPVTFAGDVAPIVFEKCVRCHREGEAAPFALTDYASVKRRAKTIRRVVDSGFMPPWHPEAGWGEFRGEHLYRLSPAEIDVIDRWVEGGTPEGDRKKTPAMPAFPDGWHHGEPDVILEMDEAFELYAEGRDVYRYFALPLGLKEDRWVRGIEVRPSARSVVHHVLFFLDTKGEARKLDAADSRAGFSGKGFRATGGLGGWAVGGTPLVLSDDFAHPMPAGSDLVLQTHFHPSGKVEREKTRIGIYFADGPPEQRLVEFQVPPGFGGPAGINIPPGESDFTLRDHMIVPEDMELITVWAHAHQVCVSTEAKAILPDGRVEPLLKIGEWDFNWQGQYQYAKPVHLPKGTRIEAALVYDNSEANTANPHTPPRRIFWGEQSTDEMGSFIFQGIASDPARQAELANGLRAEMRQSRARSAEARRIAMRLRQILALDRDADDRVSKSEVPKGRMDAFRRLDRNGDGYADAGEIAEHGAFLDDSK